MSRFSKAEAEARGWEFFHAVERRIEDLGDGVFRDVPGVLRAERYVNGHKVTEEGDTLGKLLERIHFYEKHRDGLPSAEAEVNIHAEPDPDPVHHDHTQENPIVPGPWPEEDVTDASDSATES